MSQQTSKEYLAAAEKAQQASNAALPALASTSSALEAAKNARSVLQKSLQNATNPAEKKQLSEALKDFDARVYNPAQTAFNKATTDVNVPLNNAKELRQQAEKSANSPENSVNTTPLGNLAAQDATAYPAPDPYFPNEGASAPTSVSAEQLRTIEVPNVVPVGPPVIDTGLVQTFAVSSSGNTTLASPPVASTFVPGRVSLPTVSVSNPQTVSSTDSQSARASENQTVKNAESSTLSDEEIIDLNEDIRVRIQRRIDAPLTRLDTDTVPRPQSEIDAQELSALQQAQQQQEFFANSQEFFANINGGTTQARKSENAVAVSVSKTKDLRVRISLAKEANYMYNIATPDDVLYPLKSTDGVIFPYTPQITTNYIANYDSLDVTHSNYRLHHYKNSAVDSVTIIGEFTAQDTYEANYLLAVMHFFKSATKMFYGKDQNPPAGTPPPLCYLSGYGTYAFDMHPIVISSFSLSYPNDVNYINAGAGTIQGQQLTEYKKPTFQRQRGILARIAGLKSTGVAPGGVSSKEPFTTVNNFTGITRVPTKISITITALPIVTRNNVSNQFSLREYATGALLKNRGYGGTW